jgi:hypothetical protein
MFDDLQQYVAGKTFVSAADMNTLRDAVRFLRNFFGANVLDDPDGLAFRKPTRYRDVQLIRVANEQDGQGVWDAWTLLPTTNRSHLDPSNNVSLTELFDDNEKVYFYDARDDAPTYNSPSGADRVHSFAAEFVPALKMPFTSGTGTNERRVFVATTGGSWRRLKHPRHPRPQRRLDRPRHVQGGGDDARPHGHQRDDGRERITVHQRRHRQ